MKRGQRVTIVIAVDGTKRTESGKVTAIHGSRCEVKLDSGRTVSAFASQIRMEGK